MDNFFLLSLLIVFHSFAAVKNDIISLSNWDFLYNLYYSTNGGEWKWIEPYDEKNGYPSNFTSIVFNNPCSPTHPWQGILCTEAPCSFSGCSITMIMLDDYNILGKNLAYLLYGKSFNFIVI